MRAGRLIVAAILASGGSIAAFAFAVPTSAPPPPAPTGPATRPVYTVDSLIDEILTRLVADDWRVRETAEAELADLAELAEPRLRVLAAHSTHPETRTRAKSALDQIAADAKTGMRPITLRLQQAPAREAFRRLALSGGFELGVAPVDLWELRETRELPPVTLEMRRRPFWEAYRAIQGQTGLGMTRSPDGHWTLREEGDPRLRANHAAVSGPFLLVPEVQWNVPPAPPSPLRQAPGVPAPIPMPLDTSSRGLGMTLRVLVFPEPRVRLAGGPGTILLSQARDDRGLRLDRAVGAPGFTRRPESSLPLATPVDGAWLFTASLAPPAPGASKLTVCKGNIRAAVAVRHQVLELPHPLAARDALLAGGDLRATVVEMTQAPTAGRYFVTVRLETEGRPIDRNALLSSLTHGDLRLLDAAGRAYTHRVGGTAGTAQRTLVVIEFSDAINPRDSRPGPPAKLVWDAPVETRTVDIPFEFKDVPLP